MTQQHRAPIIQEINPAVDVSSSLAGFSFTGCTLRRIRNITQKGVKTVRLKPCENPRCQHLVHSDRGRKYCSNACRQQCWRKRHPNHDRSRGVAIVRCTNCGKTFSTHQPYAKFCKTSCRVSFWQQQKRLELKNVSSSGKRYATDVIQ